MVRCRGKFRQDRAYTRLGADTAVAVDPEVLGDDDAPLVERLILGELACRRASANIFFSSPGGGGIGTHSLGLGREGLAGRLMNDRWLAGHSTAFTQRRHCRCNREFTMVMDVLRRRGRVIQYRRSREEAFE